MGGDAYKVGRVHVTGSKVVAIPASMNSGEHVTYPEDGRVHRT